jgi:membrane-bound metal-dependent hydrolase YbcI (DUF457 family)
MASYPVHLSVATALGVAYGGAAAVWGQVDWGVAFLAAGVTALGGVLPDLDSDNSVPVRELFGIAAAAAPFLLYPRMQAAGFPIEQTVVILAAVYLVIRYGVSELFKRYTRHRGMFHSIPAMFIAGLLVFLLYHNPTRWLRFYMAGGVMIGFLSHLVLDEIYSVDFMGARLKKSAGTALKFRSKSWAATLSTYMFLCGLAFAAWIDMDPPRPGTPPARSEARPPLRRGSAFSMVRGGPSAGTLIAARSVGGGA